MSVFVGIWQVFLLMTVRFAKEAINVLGGEIVTIPPRAGTPLSNLRPANGASQAELADFRK
jgi:hypothetical protein